MYYSTPYFILQLICIFIQTSLGNREQRTLCKPTYVTLHKNVCVESQATAVSRWVQEIQCVIFLLEWKSCS